jgi:hypothetical protein
MLVVSGDRKFSKFSEWCCEYSADKGWQEWESVYEGDSESVDVGQRGALYSVHASLMMLLHKYGILGKRRDKDDVTSTSPWYSLHRGYKIVSVG